MLKGWVKVHRKLLDWQWYTKPHMVHLLLHIIMKANREPGMWQGHYIGRGQLITGRKKLAQETGISERSVRTCLNLLKSTSEITIQATNKYSVITVLNYDSYQKGSEKPTSRPTSKLASDRPATDQRPTTNKNIENNKNLIKKKEEGIPSLDVFLNYVNENIDDFTHLREDLRLKYLSWVENGWRDGNNRAIDNWKSKVLNAVGYIKNRKGDPGAVFPDHYSQIWVDKHTKGADGIKIYQEYCRHLRRLGYKSQKLNGRINFVKY